MKSLILTSLTFVLFVLSPNLQAQKFTKMDASPMDIAMFRGQDKAPIVRVIYSRPQKKDREIFGKLIKYDEVWRTGANESTEITLYKDMMIGEETVEAGTYTLFTIPGEKEWTIILNKDMNTWGAFGYKEERDVVRIKTPTRNLATPIEEFSITFQPKEGGADMLMGWDDTYVQIPFEEI